MDCDGCEHREWLAEHTPIQTPLHIDAPHPTHTMRALKPYRCARSKRRYALKTALHVQTVLRVQTRFRQIGRLVRRVLEGRKGVGRGSAD